ncbi:MAG: shikimate kinase [Gemmatimonadaceae bacterium]
MGERTGVHLVLVGLPGAGKTTVGRLLAVEIGVPLVDIDLSIEARAGMPIGEIFASHGEPHFRRLEREVTEEVASRSSVVLSPGGGWIMHPDVVALVRPPSKLVHLAVSPATALDRMGNEVALRPLLSGSDPLRALGDLYRQREAAYASADAVVNTEMLTIQELVAYLAALATAWGVGIG